MSCSKDGLSSHFISNRTFSLPHLPLLQKCNRLLPCNYCTRSGQECSYEQRRRSTFTEKALTERLDVLQSRYDALAPGRTLRESVRDEKKPYTQANRPLRPTKGDAGPSQIPASRDPIASSSSAPTLQTTPVSISPSISPPAMVVSEELREQL